MRSWLMFWIICQALSILFRFSDGIYHTIEDYVPALYYETKLAAYVVLVYPNGRVIDMIEKHFTAYWNDAGRAELEKLHKVVEPYFGKVLTVVNEKVASAKAMKSSVLESKTDENTKAATTADIDAEENKQKEDVKDNREAMLNETVHVEATTVVETEG